MKRLYVIPTINCNLNCPHCYRVNEPEVFNRDKFLNIMNNFDGDILLFGGEPTLYQDRLFDIIEDNLKNGKCKISSISTNLIILNDKLINFYKSLGAISTSWNPNRFSPEEYEKWKYHLQILADNNIRFTIMITLTKDLFDIPPDIFLSIAKEWIVTDNIKIKFEHYVSDDNDIDYYQHADEWLCKLYPEWNINATMDIINRMNCWYFDCDDICTLHPDGTLSKGCPHGQNISMPEKCFKCNRVNTCRPCRLHRYCSYPNKLFELINGG